MLSADHGEHSWNVELINKTRIASEGAGQIVVEKNIAYIAHLVGEGITMVDVSDPVSPKVIAKVAPPLRSHSHKVQVADDLMLVNNERYKKNEPWVGGLRIYDVADPSSPREIGFLETGGKGVHRLWYTGGRYAHITAHQDGFTDYIYCIVDLADPTKPEIVSRFWLPGMHEAGGEQRTWDQDKRFRAHGPPMVCGDLVYLGWTDGGFTTLDISDIFHPKMLAHLNFCPPFGGLFHTVLPLPRRDLLVVTQEAHADFCQEPEKYAWIIDNRVETNPVPVSTIQVESEGFERKGGRFGPHNIHENRPSSFIDDEYVYITYFNGGLRIIDIRDKYRPREAGWFIPACPEGQSAVQTNDVFVDDHGLIYLVDRWDGSMYILRFTGRE